MATARATSAVEISASLLHEWPLPQPDEDGDKEDRGRVLCIGGEPQLPGAVILAGTAALRAGAGKLQIATSRQIALAVGTAVPEARVFALPTARSGGLGQAAAPKVAPFANLAQCVLVGPGIVDEEAASGLVAGLLPRLAQSAGVLVLDAGACVIAGRARKALQPFRGRLVVTPHAGEMAKLLGVEREQCIRDPMGVASRAADALGAVVAMKGAETFVTTPEGEAYCYREGHVGLATSGSGDTLAGIVAGLVARGASPAQATCWGVYLHGSAGNRLAERVGPLGFLARELLAEIPSLMAELDPRSSRQQPCPRPSSPS